MNTKTEETQASQGGPAAFQSTHWTVVLEAARQDSPLATGSIDGTVRLWDAASRKPLTVLVGHKEGVFYVAFARDGQTLATASGDRTVRLWNLATRREVARLDHHREVVTVGFTPKGDALISSVHGGTIHRWSAPTFVELEALEREKLQRETARE